LKTAATCALVALIVTGGLGFGLLPAQAGDQPTSAADTNGSGRRPGESLPKATKSESDAEFLRRLCLDLTGNLPNALELKYFTNDLDRNKRAKVVDWLAADENVKAYLAKKLGVPIERIQVIRGADAQGLTFKLAIIAEPNLLGVRLSERAFTPEGKVLAAAIDHDGVRIVENSHHTATVRLLADARVALDKASDLAPVGEKAAGAEEETQLQYWVSPQTQDQLQFWLSDQAQNEWRLSAIRFADSDSEFLKRAIQEARGSDPTTLEDKYFAEDKDPKKREKLLDLLLKDPAVAKKLGAEWKKKMLAPPAQQGLNFNFKPDVVRKDQLRSLYVTPRVHSEGQLYFDVRRPTPDKFEKLVGELIAAKKTDEQILEAVTLAAAGRLPTAEEKKATLAVIGTAADKKAAWIAIARTLAK
jgi:hypothetical protein